MIKRVVDSRFASHMELESIVGRLSFTQTSAFGRIGIGLMAPNYAELRDSPYRQALSTKESTALRRWAGELGHMGPRIATPKPKLTDRAAYTEASGKAHIIDAAIIDPATFKQDETITRVRASRTGRRWIKTFEDTRYIYGLEILAILAVLMTEGEDVRGKTFTFYVDNNIALDAIVKNSATPTSIQALTALIWHRIRDLGTPPWVGRVPSKRYIADLHTRYVEIPYRVTSTGGFGSTIRLGRNSNKTIQKITQ